MAEADVMSLRLDPELSDQVDLIVAVNGQTRSDFIRAAIRHWLAKTKADAEFQAALEQHLNKQRQLLAPEATDD